MLKFSDKAATSIGRSIGASKNDVCRFADDLQTDLPCHIRINIAVGGPGIE